ncbi:hypothetical protein F5X99DRAFT_430937 [Biscogniauxia marginata]|nr:hypothetical protein F5X99DRAFT_430937 [Biscogniauxia marginata]
MDADSEACLSEDRARHAAAEEASRLASRREPEPLGSGSASASASSDSRRRTMLGFARAYRTAQAARMRSLAREPAEPGELMEEQEEQGVACRDVFSRRGGAQPPRPGGDDEEAAAAAWEAYKRERQRADGGGGGEGWVDSFERAMFCTRALVAAGGLPPARLPPRVGDGNRNGGGDVTNRRPWMAIAGHDESDRPGFRHLGCMWINVKEGTRVGLNPTMVREQETMRAFVKSMFKKHELHRPGWRFDLRYRRKSLIRMLVDLENQGRPDDETLVCHYFDGSETVLFKSFNSKGVEQRMH